MIERRKHYRFLVSGTAVLRPVGSKDEIDASLKDLSLGGAAVASAEKIDVGRRVTVNIRLLDSDGVAIEDSIAGTVVWTQTWGERHGHGVAFDEPISREINALLYVFMENLQNTTGLST